MVRYIQMRLLTAIPTIIGLSVLVFLMIHLLPGDAVDVMLSEQGASAAQLAELKHEMGLDQPLPVQYWNFAKNAVRGDLGRSLFSHQLVTQQIFEQLPATIELTAAGMVVALLVGIPFGVLAAVKHETWVDSMGMIVSLIGATMPSFWIGLLLIFFFTLKLGWLPAAGTSGVKAMIMPAITLGLYSAAVIARLTRSSMLEVLRQDYVVTARAKGLSKRTTVLRHALRNALLPVVTVVGLQVGYLLGGAVITETVFARQGVGQLVVGAILQRDGPLVQGTVLLLSVIFVVTNTIVDISYAALDPRIRYR